MEELPSWLAKMDKKGKGTGIVSKIKGEIKDPKCVVRVEFLESGLKYDRAPHQLRVIEGGQLLKKLLIRTERRF